MIINLISATISSTNMMSTQFSRFIHLSTSKITMMASKSNLAKLRKKTGYPFGNCKKALEVNNNDLEKAEKWLEEQAKSLGWSKALKMESRNTPQGLIGIAFDKQYAAMVEVNCETDFVSKNDKFKALVDVIAKTCLLYTKSENPSPKSISKMMLEGENVGQLLAEDKQTLQDHVMKNVGVIGEKLLLRRAALVSVQQPSQLSVLTHPVAAAAASNYSTLLGKYGSVLVYSTTSGPSERSAQLAKQLCQHVIGMNPVKIEASPDDPTPAKPAEKQNVEVEETDDIEDKVIVDSGHDEEVVMMRQAFLLDADRTVADVVAEAGITVEDFVRFECGEGLSESEEETTKVAQMGG